MTDDPENGTRSSGRPRTWRAPAALFLVAVALRVAYVLLYRDHPRFDAPAMDAGYHLAWARAIAAGAEFQDGPFFRAPLYPLVLAGFVVLSPSGTLVPRLLQCLLGGLAVVLATRLGARVFGSRAGAVGGLLVAVSWILIAFDAELLIPTLLVPLLLFALERAVAWGGDDRPRVALVVGIAFGLAAIARPNVLLFMPVPFVWTIVRTRRVRAALALTLGTLLPILPVTLHNVLEEDPALIATQAGVNLWIGNNPESDGATAIVPGTREGWWEGYYDAIALAEAEEGKSLAPTEVSQHYVDKTLDWVRAEPGAAIAHLGWKARLLATNVELGNNQDVRFTALRTMPVLRLSPSRWDVLLGLGVVGWVAALRRRRRGAGLLVGFLLVYSLSVVLFFVNARFRVPLVPVLAIGAGSTLVLLFDALRDRRWRDAMILGVPAVAIAALSNVVPARVDRSDAAGLADLGRAELARSNADAGLAHLEQAVRLAPRSVQVRMALANAIVAAGGDPGRALRLLEEARAFPRGKDSPELEARILDLRIDAGDAEGALRTARAELQRRPGDGALRYVVARALVQVGRGPEALAMLRALTADEPTNVHAAIAIAELTAAMGRRDEALAAFERARALQDLASPEERARIAAGLAALKDDQ